MKNLNRTLMKLTLTSMFSAGVAGQALAVTASFKTYDSNGDGKISLTEFQEQGGQAQAFRDGDTNHDNSLSQDELVKADSSGDRIKAGKYIDDAWITTKVKTMLLKDEGMKGLSVDVETHKGTVQLAGWVNNATQVAEAEKIARSVKGVTEVKNTLQIKN
ncbi:BON domain-containing protein [Thiobacillus thioparus]|uniref:BON domain-containing protein n=1 Tax=Thiobacillus thioparus TaxID=931 RepID=UPI00039B5307|nr:BON domain-containing protein [Thiobacillus thioparus]